MNYKNIFKTDCATVIYIDLRNFKFLSSRILNNKNELINIDSTYLKYHPELQAIIKKLKKCNTVNNSKKNNCYLYQIRFEYLMFTMQELINKWNAVSQKHGSLNRVKNIMFNFSDESMIIAFLEGNHHYAAINTAIDIAVELRKNIDENINPVLSNELNIKRADELLDFGIGIHSSEINMIEFADMPKESVLKADKKYKTSFKNSVFLFGAAVNFAMLVGQTSKMHWDSYIIISETTINKICELQKSNFENYRKTEDFLEATFRHPFKFFGEHKLKGSKKLGLFVCYFSADSE